MGMRRSVWVMAGTAVGVFLLSVCFQVQGDRLGAARYHQHLEQPSEEELGVCEVCGGEGPLCTHLPIIQIETGGQTIPGRPYLGGDGRVAGYFTGDHGEEEIQVRFSSVDGEAWHHPDDEPSAVGLAFFRFRGNSSRWFSKGSYRLRLAKDMGLLGMEKGNEWALYGPFLDKTLMRNYMWMNLSGEVMGTWTPNVRFCEVLLDGAYQGVYVLMEMIDVSEERLNLTKYQKGAPVFSYLVRIEPNTNPQKEIQVFSEYTYRMEPGRHMELIYPGISNQTEEVKRYVQTDFSEVEKLLYSLKMKDGSKQWKDELNMDSFVNYYILMEFLSVNDTFTASTYFYRDARGKISIGPVWDYNNVLDNFFNPMPEREFILSQRGWFAMLMQDEEFVEAVIRRYRQLREGTLSEEHLLSYVRKVEEWLGSAIDRNYQVWGYSFDPSQVTRGERKEAGSGQASTGGSTNTPNDETDMPESARGLNPSNYEEAVEWMTDYMVNRGRWMDWNIESLRQYCHPSRKGS